MFHSVHCYTRLASLEGEGQEVSVVDADSNICPDVEGDADKQAAQHVGNQSKSTTFRFQWKDYV